MMSISLHKYENLTFLLEECMADGTLLLLLRVPNTYKAPSIVTISSTYGYRSNAFILGFFLLFFQGFKKYSC